MATHVQVVLKKDVDNLGRQGELVRVRPGYARNFLLPRGLAQVATRGNLKQIEHEQQAAERRLAKVRAEQEELADKLKKVTVSIAKEAGDEGKLFGSVTAAEVADALKAKGYDVDKKKLVLPEDAIKVVGTYEIGLKLLGGVTAKFKLDVKTAA